MTKRAFVIGIIIVLAIISVAFYLQKDVSYKELTLSDAPPEIKSHLANLPSSANTSKGMAQIGLKTYATIMGQSGQQIEVISVVKSENVGIDVFYRITELTHSNSERPVKIVSFLNIFGGPVGFKELD